MPTPSIITIKWKVQDPGWFSRFNVPLNNISVISRYNLKIWTILPYKRWPRLVSCLKVAARTSDIETPRPKGYIIMANKGISKRFRKPIFWHRQLVRAGLSLQIWSQPSLSAAVMINPKRLLPYCKITQTDIDFTTHSSFSNHGSNDQLLQVC